MLISLLRGNRGGVYAAVGVESPPVELFLLPERSEIRRLAHLPVVHPFLPTVYFTGLSRSSSQREGQCLYTWYACLGAVVDSACN